MAFNPRRLDPKLAPDPRPRRHTAELKSLVTITVPVTTRTRFRSAHAPRRAAGDLASAEALAQLPFFRSAGFTAQHCVDIRCRKLSDGEYVYDQGSSAFFVYVLLSGSVRLTRRQSWRGERHVHDVVVHEAIGELGLLTRQPHVSAARATGAAEVACIPGSLYLLLAAADAGARLAAAIAPLRALPRFGRLADGTLAALAHLATPFTFHPGSSILVHGGFGRKPPTEPLPPIDLSESHRPDASLVERGDVAILVSGTAQLLAVSGDGHDGARGASAFTSVSLASLAPGDLLCADEGIAPLRLSPPANALSLVAAVHGEEPVEVRVVVGAGVGVGAE